MPGTVRNAIAVLVLSWGLVGSYPASAADMPPSVAAAEVAADYCSAEFRRHLIQLAKRGKGDMSQADDVWRLSGWLDLIKQLERRPCDNQRAMARAGDWLERYVDHPAVRYLPGLFVGVSPADGERSVGDAAQVASLSLLLPLSGPYSQFARQVWQGARDGAAQLGAKLSLYDTGDGLSKLPRRAFSIGGDCIVGPLRKGHVDLLATLGPSLPVLALNYVSDKRPAPSGFYQMALTPEDEAWALSERLSAGHVRGVILFPKGWDWAERLLTRFTDLWRRRGGEIADAVGYDPLLTDFTAPIQRVLGVRYRERLDSRTGEMRRSRPRRRTDIDFILLLADYRLGRMLHPQLRFWYSEGLPVYASSHILDGRLKDIHYDLEGVRPMLPPWLEEAAGEQRLEWEAAARFLGKSAIRNAILTRCMAEPSGMGKEPWRFDPSTRRYHYRSRSAVIEQGRVRITDR